jgi:hypothetical protein
VITENPVIDPAVIARVHKLLNLARDGGATENEAAVAMEKATEILAQHNLSMAQIEAGGGGAQEAREQHRDNERLLMYRWAQEIMRAAAEVSFCWCDLREGTRPSKRDPYRSVKSWHYRVIGRQSNVVAARNLFDYLTRTVARLSLEHVGGDVARNHSREAHLFRAGAAERLVERLRERHERRLREQREQVERQQRETAARAAHPGAAPSGNALVVVLADYARDEADANEDVRYGLAPGTTARNRAEDAQRREQWRRERDEKAARIAALIKEHKCSFDVAYNVVELGMTLERAIEVEASKAARQEAEKPETEKQRQARVDREAREERTYHERQARRQEAEARRRSHPSFRSGARRADDIGLDEQINKDNKRRLT